MAYDNHYDVIIIGTGAGGGTLAHRLAPSGKRILLIERGPYVPREKENWDSHAVNVEARYHIKEPWFDKDSNLFHAGAHYYVGGNTKFYGAALIRLRQQDFGEVRHHGGLSPAWPIRYEDHAWARPTSFWSRRMTCRELIDFLMEYWSGELSANRRKVFDAHLRACPKCVAYVKGYEEAVRLGKAVLSHPDERVPADVPEELVQAILAARRAPS